MKKEDLSMEEIVKIAIEQAGENAEEKNKNGGHGGNGASRDQQGYRGSTAGNC